MSKKQERADALRDETKALIQAFSELSDAEKNHVSLELSSMMLLTEMEEGRLSRAAVSLELMSSVLSAHDGGLRHSDLRHCYPVKAWREKTVELPRAWISALVEGWREYRAAGPETNLGEKLGVDGRGQGRQPTRVILEGLKQDVRRHNAVDFEQRLAALEGRFLSLEKAIASVADDLGISEDAVKRSVSKVKKKKGE